MTDEELPTDCTMTQLVHKQKSTAKCSGLHLFEQHMSWLKKENVLRAGSCWHVCGPHDVTSRNVRLLSVRTPRAINRHMRSAIRDH